MVKCECFAQNCEEINPENQVFFSLPLGVSTSHSKGLCDISVTEQDTHYFSITLHPLFVKNHADVL